MKKRIAKTMQSESAFTLAEALTVIAIIGILAALLMPAADAVRNSLRVSLTRSRFARYALAYESFKSEYKYYPSMGAETARFELNGHNAVFIETLSGRTKEGAQTANAYALKANPRLIRFLDMAQDDFAPAGSPNSGLITDTFGNPNIVAVVDRNQDGIISAEDFAAGDLDGLPAEERPANIYAGVVFISLNKDHNPDWQWVYSWR